MSGLLILRLDSAVIVMCQSSVQGLSYLSHVTNQCCLEVVSDLSQISHTITYGC